MGQVLLTIFYLVWLIAVLVFLGLIYWQNKRYIHHMETTMIASRAVSSEAALKSAQAAEKLAEMLQEERHAP